MKRLLLAALASGLTLVLAGSHAARANAPADRPLDLRIAEASDGHGMPDSGNVGVAPAPTPTPTAPTVALKSPATARVLAVGATASAVLLFAVPLAFGEGELGLLAGGAALMVAPSAGHIYAGEGLHALGFSALRGAANVGVIAFAFGGWCIDECRGNQPSRWWDVGQYASLGVSLALTAYDIWDSARAARRFNARVRASAEITASVVPTLDPQRRGGGLALVGAF